MARKHKTFDYICKQFDLFGTRPQLNFKGKRTFKTQIGAWATLICTAIIIHSSFAHFTNFLSGKIDTLNTEPRYVDISKYQNSWKPFETGFRFAVGFLKPLPPTIG